MTTNNFNALVAVRNFSREVSKEDKVYYKVEIQVFATKHDVDWTAPIERITKVNVSETFYKLWLRDKLISSNILMLSIDKHIAKVTTYEDEDGIHTHDKDGYEITEALQATIFDLVEVNASYDISLYMSYMQEAIKLACIKSERMSR